MKKLINFITILFILPLLNTNIYAVEVIDKGAEVIDKIKNDGTTILKSLTRKSLNKDEIKNFLIEYVITIDDERGDGIVTYFLIMLLIKDLKI
jgi:chaperonin GroEL (HSP60 family)